MKCFNCGSYIEILSPEKPHTIGAQLTNGEVICIKCVKNIPWGKQHGKTIKINKKIRRYNMEIHIEGWDWVKKAALKTIGKKHIEGKLISSDWKKKDFN